MHSCGNIWHDLFVNGAAAIPYLTFGFIWAGIQLRQLLWRQRK